MENIHILGTDNPSRLHWYGDGFFGLSKVYLPWKEGKNIYITNGDEVKLHDYYIKGDEPILAVWVPVSSDCKKVIMTTDRDLIRDCVQAIDDEFLEWFIKNPSCEGVEVIYEVLNPFQSHDKGYILRFPDDDILEEPKQERMYSEEDMKLAYKTGARLALISQSDLALCKGKFPTPDEWFNEFNNK
jgi:hypothetical protein